MCVSCVFFFFSSRRRHTRLQGDWSSDVCSSDLAVVGHGEAPRGGECAWLEGLTLVGKDVEIPAGVRIGRASVVGIGAGPHDFVAEELAAGTLLPSRSWLTDLP